MPSTALGLPYPSSTSAVNPPSDIQALAAAVDTLMTLLVTKVRFHIVQVGVAQNIPNGTGDVVTFNTEIQDTAGGHDLVTNTSRYTVQSGHGGLWLLGGKMSWDGNTTNRRIGLFRKNGSITIEGSYVSMPPATTTGILPMPAIIANLSAGDYVELHQNQDSGGTRTTFNGDSSSGATLWGGRLGL